MEQRTNGLTYTHAGDVRAARLNYAGAYRTADVTKAYQRPGKSVTPYMLTLADGRERRVYAMAYGNGAVPYVIVKGVDVLLDDQTRDALARMHAHGTPFQPVRPHAEMVADAKSQILEDVRNGIVPANVPGFNELHDYADANMYGWREEDEDTSYISSPVIGPVQEEVHQWIVSGGIVAAAGTTELVTDDATTEAVWEAYGDGFGELAGNLADGDPFVAGVVCLDDRTWLASIETEHGQRTVYKLSAESDALVWLATQRARLTALPIEEWPASLVQEEGEEEDEGIVSERQARAARGQVGWDGSSSELGDPRAWPL